MKQRLVVALIVSTLALLGSVQYAFGAAVMSIDLGSEWMKVSAVSVLLSDKKVNVNSFMDFSCVHFYT